MKRVLSLCCFLVLLLSLSACGTKDNGVLEEEYSPPDLGFGDQSGFEDEYVPPDYGDLSGDVDDFVDEYGGAVPESPTAEVSYDSEVLVALAEKHPTGRAKVLSDYFSEMQRLSDGYRMDSYITVDEVLYGREILGLRANRIRFDVLVEVDKYIKALSSMKIACPELYQTHLIFIQSVRSYRDGYTTLLYFLDNNAQELLIRSGDEFDSNIGYMADYALSVNSYSAKVIEQSGTPLDIVGDAKGEVGADGGGGVKIEMPVESGDTTEVVEDSGVESTP